MNHQIILIKGHVKIRNADTGIILYETDNLIVNSGKNFLARRIVDGTVGLIQIGVGSSSTAASANDTDLGSAIMWKYILTQEYINNNVYVTTTFLNSEANGTWREVGLRSTGNNLVARTVIADFTKTNTQNVLVEWTLTVV